MEFYIFFDSKIDVLTEKQDLSLIDNPAMCTVSTAYSMAFASPDFPSYQMVQPIFNGIYGTENRQITPSVDISILHDIANSDDDSLSTATCNWGVDKITINCISWLQNLDIKLVDLESRLNTVLPVEILNPPDEEKMNLINFELQQRGLEINDKEMKYIFTHHSRDLNSLLNLAEKLDEISHQEKKSISINLIKKII